jgi:hypothetical protein
LSETTKLMSSISALRTIRPRFAIYNANLKNKVFLSTKKSRRKKLKSKDSRPKTIRQPGISKKRLKKLISSRLPWTKNSLINQM